MTIYVVERMFDYTTQLGWSTSYEVATKMCKKYSKQVNDRCWIKKYTTDNENWCEFDCD